MWQLRRAVGKKNVIHSKATVAHLIVGGWMLTGTYHATALWQRWSMQRTFEEIHPIMNSDCQKVINMNNNEHALFVLITIQKPSLTIWASVRFNVKKLSEGEVVWGLCWQNTTYHAMSNNIVTDKCEDNYHHHFQPTDQRAFGVLSQSWSDYNDHCAIAVFQLFKWRSWRIENIRQQIVITDQLRAFKGAAIIEGWPQIVISS